VSHVNVRAIVEPIQTESVSRKLDTMVVTPTTMLTARRGGDGDGRRLELLSQPFRP
jgi:hypothetical protein